MTPALVFWSLAGAMVVLAVLGLSRGMRRGAPTAERQNQIALFQARLAELEAERDSGKLSPEQARLMREEMESALLRELEQQAAAPRTTDEQQQRRGGRSGGVIAALLIPPLSVAGYLHLGSPQLADPSFMAAQQQPAQPDLSIAEVLQELEARARQRPDDAHAWMLLTRTYLVLGETEKAVAAAETLYKLSGDQPRVLVHYIEALALAADGDLTGKPRRLIERLLSLDPEHKSGLWFAGLAAEQAGELRQALAHWQKLLPLMEGEQAPQERVRALIARVETRLEGGGAADTA